MTQSASTIAHSDAAAPPVTGVHHVSLTVPDLDRSVPWYSELFGLVRIMDEPHYGGRAVVLMQPQAHVFIGLHAHDANQRESFAETRTGLDHLSFAVSSRDVLLEWQRRLAQRSIVHSEIKDVSYGSVLVFRDPDNIQLELIAPAR
jgi:catechol 2,3-dioxygenase-like lactoylglutathione lyase family enzyme